MHIYAMSDIHGCLDAFKASLSTVDLDAEDSKLVLLGDYCDRGPDSLGVFELVMDLQLAAQPALASKPASAPPKNSSNINLGSRIA